ncbi:MAG: hypothetical protein JSV39_00430 [Candidatus Aenigmatarchaeota archaeon]|nr:MAG: hypothetical protein JSV39_00430 [Candidatus Aenigmarchaeota archaeon]
MKWKIGVLILVIVLVSVAGITLMIPFNYTTEGEMTQSDTTGDATGGEKTRTCYIYFTGEHEPTEYEDEKGDFHCWTEVAGCDDCCSSCLSYSGTKVVGSKESWCTEIEKT